MAYRLASPIQHALLLRKPGMETGLRDPFRVDMRDLSSRKVRRPLSRVRGLINRSNEAVLIELGSRRGEWVPAVEIQKVYGLTERAVRLAIRAIREKYPYVVIENRTSVGYRLSGPLPAHVERIAPK